MNSVIQQMLHTELELRLKLAYQLSRLKNYCLSGFKAKLLFCQEGRNANMGFTTLIMIFGLVFGMISIKLMSMLENAQIVVVKQTRFSRSALGKTGTVPGKMILTFTIGAHRLVFLRFGVWFFARISSLIFTVEAMYPEKFVEGATLKMMKSVMISNQIRATTIKKGRHLVRTMRLSTSREKTAD